MDELKNNKVYNLTKPKWKIAKNPLRRFCHYLGLLFRGISDIFFGLDSGYKMCCINAYIINRKYTIPEIPQILCYKCFKKILKGEKKLG